MKGTTHLAYKRRLRRSTLSPMARHVAAVLADLHYEKGLTNFEGLSLTLAAIGRETGMSRSTAIRYLDECIECGWVHRYRVRTANRNQASQYLLTIPTGPDRRPSPRQRGRSMTDDDLARLHKVESPNRETLNQDLRVRSSDVQPDTQSDHGSNDEYVVLKRVADADAAPRGGGGSNEQEQTESREPSLAAVAPPVNAARAVEVAAGIDADIAAEMERINALRARGRNRLPRVLA